MRNHIYKYKKSSSCLLLLAYSFLVVLSILHYHSINVGDDNYQYTNHSEKQSGTPIDEVVGLDSECIVTHFTSTISNLNYFLEIFCGVDEIKICFSLNPSDKLYYLISYENNPLRAPPIVLPS